MSSNKFYITTAIDYVNSVPHLGTAYEKIGADVIARYKRRKGFDTFFLMGTDEHSLNVEKQAKVQGIDPKEYCNKMVQKFLEVWKKLDISFNDFIRTTEKRHIDSVNRLTDAIYKKGDIRKGWYKGWYCVSCEAYLKEKDLVDGKCATHNKTPQWIEEENYYFNLSTYEERLLKHIENNPDFIQPNIRRNEILNIIKGGLEDISISRSGTSWGIPVPFDKKQVIYVWVDALINYISGIGYATEKEEFNKYWPCNLHVIGKDITRFHCIIWPAMLMSAGIELPKTVFGHGFVYLGGEKMSKTKGTVVDPLEIVGKYGADPIRYFLMREVPFDRDGEFTWEKFIARYNSDLANDLGNLLQRVLKMIHKYNKGVIEKVSLDQGSNNFVDGVKNTVSTYIKHMDKYQLSQALASVWDLISRANRYVEEERPWYLNKNGEKEKLNNVLYNLAESIRIIACLIEPFMPKTAISIWKQECYKDAFLGNVFEKITEWGGICSGHKVGVPEPLFPKSE